MSINFSFLENENRELYDLCCKAENLSKTDPRNAIIGSRIALEYFIKRVCYLHNVTFDDHELPNKKNSGDKVPVPELNKMIYKTRKLNIFTKHQFDFMNDIRRLGNKSVHPNYIGEDDELEQMLNDQEEVEVKKVSTSLAIDLISKLHTILREYFQKKYPGVAPFDKDRIPIDNMIPIEVLPLDNDEACDAKYSCKLVNEFTLNEMYFIVRQYSIEKTKQDKTFTLRDMYVLEKLSQTGSGAANLVKYVRVNVDRQSDLFFTCFEISNGAVTLDKFSLTKLSILEKLKLLKGIANGVKELHYHSTPIVHRALRPSSIYLVNQNHPLIGNFEYSKIENPQLATVYHNYLKRKDPFKAPEVLTEREVTQWPSVDIYSLGVIILYVFGQRITGALEPTSLKKIGISKDFIDMVFNMISDTPAERPTIVEVIKGIEAEERYHG